MERDQRQRRGLRLAAAFGGLTALLWVFAALNLNSGTIALEPGQLARILFGGAGEDTAGKIIWEIRLPRLLSAAILGGALSVAGFLLQTFFSNPIAGPFVLGISSGAKLSVSLVMIGLLSRGIRVGSWGMIAAAFGGAMVSMGFVLAISGRVRQMAVLVVCGVMISYICSAATDFIVTFADDANIVNLHNWSMGSFSGMSWENVHVMAAVVFLAVLASFLMAKPISAYQLGEVYAQNMGVNIRQFRAALILLSSILAACVTAFAGPISFVGVAVPHLVKRLFGTAKPLVVIPGCFLGGAAFCLFCDWVARTLFAPTELSISSVTAVFGAPIVIGIMLHGRRGRR